MTLTPTPMLGAKTIAIFWAASTIARLPASSKPGCADHHVDARIGTGFQMRKCCLGSSEIDKHISTADGRQICNDLNSGGAPKKFCAIVTRCCAVARSNAAVIVASGCANAASISIRPMRPEAPAIASFNWKARALAQASECQAPFLPALVPAAASYGHRVRESNVGHLFLRHLVGPEAVELVVLEENG